MRANVGAYVGRGATPFLKCLLFFCAVLLMVSPVIAAGDVNMTPLFDNSDLVHYNVSSVVSNDQSTPFIVWFAAAVAGIVLLVLSFMSGLFSDGEEGLVSILAWLPLGFATYTSRAVDMVNAYGVTGIAEAPVGANGAYSFNEYVLMEAHTVYHFDVITVVLFVLLVFSFGNTYRIWATQKKMKELSTANKGRI